MSVCVCLPSQLFKGKFYYCVGFDVKNITNRSDCLAANYRWVHHKYNFDNLGQVRAMIVFVTVVCHRRRFINQGDTPLPFVCLLQALMSLFVLASKDGWVNIMYHGLDAVGIDQQVIKD